MCHEQVASHGVPVSNCLFILRVWQLPLNSARILLPSLEIPIVLIVAGCCKKKKWTVKGAVVFKLIGDPVSTPHHLHVHTLIVASVMQAVERSKCHHDD